MSRDRRLKPLVETACGLDGEATKATVSATRKIAQPIDLQPSQPNNCSDCGKGKRRAKQKYTELDTIEKAQSMVRCGHGDGFISDYLGMVESQVARIRATAHSSRRGRPPTAGDGPPIDDERSRTIYAENCRQSSEALARAIGRTA